MSFVDSFDLHTDCFAGSLVDWTHSLFLLCIAATVVQNQHQEAFDLFVHLDLARKNVVLFAGHESRSPERSVRLNGWIGIDTMVSSEVSSEASIQCPPAIVEAMAYCGLVVEKSHQGLTLYKIGPDQIISVTLPLYV